MLESHKHAAASKYAGDRDLRPLIDATGSSDFGPALLSLLKKACAAEHCALYYMDDDGFSDIAAASPGRDRTAGQQARLYTAEQFWRRDPGLQPLWTCDERDWPTLARIDIDNLEYDELRERVYRPHGVLERIVINARVPDGLIALSALRTNARGRFDPGEYGAIQNLAGTLISLSAKHVALQRSTLNSVSALDTLPAIERCIAKAMPKLARREAEVCARVLYGMATPGIAIDLSIQEDSAMTYRKRAYKRLRIGSQRELLLWYLDQWSRQKIQTPCSRLS